MAWNTSDRARRLPPNWPVMRAAILRRDNGVCHVCGKHGADQVDHITSGDNHALDNLAAIHSDPCHRTKSSSEGGKGRREVSSEAAPATAGRVARRVVIYCSHSAQRRLITPQPPPADCRARADAGRIVGA
ncbi:HNH endonuclease [Streptomyces sp. NPDC102274]|uniref:HNH endonuclease n=1 Tax=Streptomyces sp. NPDC102274 TaxID=3366151 RepID=UPI00381AA88C